MVEQALRPVIVGGLSFLAALLLYPQVIEWLRSRKLGQTIHSYGPATHAAKAGTPTTGGIVFVLPPLVAFFVLGRTPATCAVALGLVGGALTGLLDDRANVIGKGALGLLARQKLALQCVVGVGVAIATIPAHVSSQWVPFGTTMNFGMWAPIFAALIVVAETNAVNITDGLDGLAGTTSGIALVVLTWIAMAEHATAMSALLASLVGALVAFLLFNWKPAAIFMGDSGALALGCVIAASAIVLHVEWILPLLGLVFLIEIGSVIINVTAIVRFHHRVFRSSPLHHHFEEGGSGELSIVLGFTTVGVLAACLAVLVLAPVVARLG